MEIKKLLGQNINAQLAIQRKDQKDLAAFLGVTANTISYFCSGKRAPSYDRLIKISDFLGVSTDALLGRASGSMTEEESLMLASEVTGLSLKAIRGIQELDATTTKARILFEEAGGEEVDAPDSFDILDKLLSKKQGYDFFGQLATVEHFVSLASVAVSASASAEQNERHQLLSDAALAIKRELYFLTESARALAQEVCNADAVLGKLEDAMLAGIISYCGRGEEADDGERS